MSTQDLTLQAGGAAPTALIADDEPLLRDSLVRALAVAWPELLVLGQARNGREALEMYEQLQPEIVFLDIHMPGLSGIEVGRQLARRAHLVFVTAYEQYAVQAFDQGAVDYLIKPLDELRLTETVERLKARWAERRKQGAGLAGEAMEAVLSKLLERLGQTPGSSNARTGAGIDAGQTQAGKPYLRWIRASVGAALKLIPVEEILYLRSDEKYTLVAWREGEALIRTPIRELLEQMDPASFVQVHRSVVVNLHAISHVTRGPNETADVHLKGRSEVLPVSRSYLHLFRQM